MKSSVKCSIGRENGDECQANKPKQGVWEKAKRIAGAAVLGAGIMITAPSCTGETDLERYRHRDSPDAEISDSDAGIGADADYDNDAGLEQDAGTEQDAGCVPSLSATTTLKLQVGNNIIWFDAGKSVYIGDKQYKVDVAGNSSTIMFTDDDGNVETITGTGYVNGIEVTELDRKVDLDSYESRVLLKVDAEGLSTHAILGEQDSSGFSIGNAAVKITVDGISSWDNDGDVASATISVTYGGAFAEFSGKELKAGAPLTLAINGSEIQISAVEFANDLYPTEEEAACTSTRVLASVVLNGVRMPDYGEGQAVEVMDGVEVEFVKLFPGASEGAKMAELEVSINGVVQRRMASAGDRLEFSIGGNSAVLEIRDINFSREEEQ